MCRSVPQMDATFTFTSTSVRPKVGILTSRISAPGAASGLTTAIIVVAMIATYQTDMKLKNALNTKRMILAPGGQSSGAAASILRLCSGGYNRAMRGGLSTSKRIMLVLVCALCCLAAAQTAPPVSRQEFTRRLVAAAIERTHHSVRYVSEYVRIPYPGGDVPADTGVCTDEIIRSYRAVGVDLQKEVHEDMLRNFAAYPDRQRWHLGHPDPNIDHRRVPNLMVF